MDLLFISYANGFPPGDPTWLGDDKVLQISHDIGVIKGIKNIDVNGGMHPTLTEDLIVEQSCKKNHLKRININKINTRAEIKSPNDSQMSLLEGTGEIKDVAGSSINRF